MRTRESARARAVCCHPRNHRGGALARAAHSTMERMGVAFFAAFVCVVARMDLPSSPSSSPLVQSGREPPGGRGGAALPCARFFTGSLKPRNTRETSTRTGTYSASARDAPDATARPTTRRAAPPTPTRPPRRPRLLLHRPTRLHHRTTQPRPQTHRKERRRTRATCGPIPSTQRAQREARRRRRRRCCM